MPEIQDFDFIKVLGKGGFATVYMGKFLYHYLFFSQEENEWNALRIENG